MNDNYVTLYRGDHTVVMYDPSGNEDCDRCSGETPLRFHVVHEGDGESGPFTVTKAMCLSCILDLVVMQDRIFGEREP